MNVGEKIIAFKDKLEHSNFQDFGRSAKVSGDWINELSKKQKIKVTDMDNVINLCDYLGITINQLVVNDEDKSPNVIEQDVFTDEDPNDIGVLLNKLTILLSQDDCKLSGVAMSDKARQICLDSLNVAYTLTKQHL